MRLLADSPSEERGDLVVGVSEMAVSACSSDVVVTYSLGSCIGLALYDPDAGVGGIAHCMLPLSKADPTKARLNPMMFTDTGVMRLMQALFDLGAKRRSLVAKLAGGAHLPSAIDGGYRIGQRNVAVVRMVLWKNDVLISGEDVGGDEPRSLFLHMDTGIAVVRKKGVLLEL